MRRIRSSDCADCGPRDGTHHLSSFCDDSCFYANDTVCDDGGIGAEFALCELGTDCVDCKNNTSPYPEGRTHGAEVRAMIADILKPPPSPPPQPPSPPPPPPSPPRPPHVDAKTKHHSKLPPGGGKGGAHLVQLRVAGGEACLATGNAPASLVLRTAACADDLSQRFTYDERRSHLKPVTNPAACVKMGAEGEWSIAHCHGGADAEAATQRFVPWVVATGGTLYYCAEMYAPSAADEGLEGHAACAVAVAPAASEDDDVAGLDGGGTNGTLGGGGEADTVAHNMGGAVVAALAATIVIAAICCMRRRRYGKRLLDAPDPPTAAQMDGWTPSLQDSGRWTSSSDRRWSMDDEEAERSRVAKELDDELDGGTELAPAKGRSINMDD